MAAQAVRPSDAAPATPRWRTVDIVVTAVIGVSDRPQMARVRGCRYCAMNETCQLRKGGNTCGIS